MLCCCEFYQKLVHLLTEAFASRLWYDACVQRAQSQQIENKNKMELYQDIVDFCVFACVCVCNGRAIERSSKLWAIEVPEECVIKPFGYDNVYEKNQTLFSIFLFFHCFFFLFSLLHNWMESKNTNLVSMHDSNWVYACASVRAPPPCESYATIRFRIAIRRPLQHQGNDHQRQYNKLYVGLCRIE